MTALYSNDPMLQKLLRFFKQTQAFERRPIQHPDQTINRLIHSAELPERQFRRAAVLIAIVTDLEIPAIVLTQRTEHLSSHPGQVAFPGGKEDPGDAGPVHTALRESEEEMGIRPEHVRLIGSISPIYVAPSNYSVLPFVGYSEVAPDYVPDPTEVEEVVELPLEELTRPGCAVSSVWELRGQKMAVPHFQIRGKRIWGASAMMLSEFLCLIDRSPEPVLLSTDDTVGR